MHCFFWDNRIDTVGGHGGRLTMRWPERAAASGCESLERLLAALILIIILLTDLMVAPFLTGQKFLYLAHTSVTLRIVTEPNITAIGQMVAL